MQTLDRRYNASPWSPWAVIGTWMLLAASQAMAQQVEVRIERPKGALVAGETIEVPVIVEDGDLNVVSYALRVHYSSDVLRIVEIVGGTFRGFADDPVTDRDRFASGSTDFTANNRELLATPRRFEAARILFEVVAGETRRAFINIGPSPRGELLVGPRFDAQEVRFRGGGGVEVQPSVTDPGD